MSKRSETRKYSQILLSMNEFYINFQRLSIFQRQNLIKKLLNKLKNANKEDALSLLIWISALDDAFDLFIQIQGRLPLKELTKLIKAYDLTRDNSFLHTRHRVESETYSKDKLKRLAAESIMILIREIGYSLHRFPYEEQSVAYNKLTTSLEKEPYWGHIHTLDIVYMVTDMKEDQKKFEDLIEERSQAKNEQTKLEVTEVYEQLYQAYIDVINFVDMMSRKMKDCPAWQDLAHDIKELIAEYSAKIDAHETRLENAKKDEENDNPSNDTPNDQDDPNAGDLPNDDTPNDQDPDNGRE